MGTTMMNAPHGPGGVNRLGVVAGRERAEKGNVVDEADQGAKQNRAEPGNEPNDNRKKRQSYKPSAAAA